MDIVEKLAGKREAVKIVAEAKEKTYSLADLEKIADGFAVEFKRDLAKKIASLTDYPMGHPIDFVAAVALEMVTRQYSDSNTKKALKRLKKSSVWLEMF